MWRAKEVGSSLDRQPRPIGSPTGQPPTGCLDHVRIVSPHPLPQNPTPHRGLRSHLDSGSVVDSRRADCRVIGAAEKYRVRESR